MTKSVFLVHDAIAKPFVRQLAVDLSLAGAKVWLDETEIGSVDSLTRKIDEEKLLDVYLAFVLTPDSVDSEWLYREIDMALNQEISRVRVRLLPLLYADCQVPPSMVNKICADFRCKDHYSSMLRRIINRLDLGCNGSGKALPDRLSGMWQGSWNWCGRPRNADMVLSPFPEIPSKMVIRYKKSGISTIVEQILDVRISENSVKLIGRDYRMIERGIAVKWHLDSLKLTLDEDSGTLKGTQMDKRGDQSDVLFKRKSLDHQIL